MWAENWDAVTVFLDCETAWRRLAATGVGLIWEGLDYSHVDVVLRRRGFEGDEVFAAVRILEREALSVLNERMS